MLLSFLQILLSGTRHYDPSFSDSHTLLMSGLICGACSNYIPTCEESSAEVDQCIMCTVAGLAPATNYTVRITALSDIGSGAGSEERTEQTESHSKLITVYVTVTVLTVKVAHGTLCNKYSKLDILSCSLLQGLQ